MMKLIIMKLVMLMIPVDAVDDNKNDEVDYNEIGDVDDELTSSS